MIDHARTVSVSPWGLRGLLLGAVLMACGPIGAEDDGAAIPREDLEFIDLDIDRLPLQQALAQVLQRSSDLDLHVHAGLTARGRQVLLHGDALTPLQALRAIAWAIDGHLYEQPDLGWVLGGGREAAHELRIHRCEGIPGLADDDGELAAPWRRALRNRMPEEAVEIRTALWNDHLIVEAPGWQQDQIAQLLEVARRVATLEQVDPSRSLRPDLHFVAHADQREVDLRFEEAPIHEVALGIAAAFDRPVVVHTDLLGREATGTYPCTFFLNQVRLSSLMHYLETCTGAEWWIADGVIRVGGAGESTNDWRAYQLFGPEGELDALTRALETVAGGDEQTDPHWAIRIGDRALVSTGTHQHRRLRELLAELRSGRKSQATADDP